MVCLCVEGCMNQHIFLEPHFVMSLTLNSRLPKCISTTFFVQYNYHYVTFIMHSSWPAQRSLMRGWIHEVSSGFWPLVLAGTFWILKEVAIGFIDILLNILISFVWWWMMSEQHLCMYHLIFASWIFVAGEISSLAFAAFVGKWNWNVDMNIPINTVKYKHRARRISVIFDCKFLTFIPVNEWYFSFNAFLSSGAWLWVLSCTTLVYICDQAWRNQDKSLKGYLE